MLGLSSEDQLFDAREHIDDIIKFIIEFPNGGRVNQGFDCYGGEGMFQTSCMEHDLTCAYFDMVRSRDQNILTKRGFFDALSKTCSVEPLGLQVLGPDCSWQTFLCLNHSKRSDENPLGNMANPKVEKSNLIAVNTTILALVGDIRGVFGVIEQPADTWYFKSPWNVRFATLKKWGLTQTYMRFLGSHVLVYYMFSDRVPN